MLNSGRHKRGSEEAFDLRIDILGNTLLLKISVECWNPLGYFVFQKDHFSVTFKSSFLVGLDWFLFSFSAYLCLVSNVLSEDSVH